MGFPYLARCIKISIQFGVSTNYWQISMTDLSLTKINNLLKYCRFKTEIFRRGHFACF